MGDYGLINGATSRTTFLFLQIPSAPDKCSVTSAMQSLSAPTLTFATLAKRNVPPPSNPHQ